MFPNKEGQVAFYKLKAELDSQNNSDTSSRMGGISSGKRTKAPFYEII